MKASNAWYGVVGIVDKISTFQPPGPGFYRRDLNITCPYEVDKLCTVGG